MATELRFDFVCPKTKDELQPSSGGLFCPQCDKHVLDFSEASRSEIVHALRQHKSMPCAILPVDVLAPAKPVVQHWWSPWRKSAALLALFLVMGEVKTLLAQTKIALKPADSKKATAPLGYQKVVFSGVISDSTGKGIPGANVTFTFLGNTVGFAKTGQNGAYEASVQNYGGIREVDISVGADGYFGYHLSDVSLSKSNPVFSTQLVPKAPANEWILGETMVLGGLGFYTYRMNAYTWTENANVDVFGHSYPQFNLEEPVYLSEKLSYTARVIDKQGNPIPGAKVELNFPKNTARQGFTDNSGGLRMCMQLEEKAIHANISISAPGYYTKTIPFYEFDEDDTQVHKLIKKPVEKPEEPIETVPENALPASANEPITEKERITETASILLYPNPANETVTIKLPGTYNTTVQVSDQNGRIVLRKSSFRQPSLTLDTQAFAIGAYTVQVTCNGNMYHEKLLIVR